MEKKIKTVKNYNPAKIKNPIKWKNPVNLEKWNRHYLGKWKILYILGKFEESNKNLSISIKFTYLIKTCFSESTKTIFN